MNRKATNFCLISVFSFAAFLAPFTSTARAQSTAAKAAVESRTYVASREVTMQAVVDSVVKAPTSGMAPGGHVILATGSGNLDGSVGPYALSGAKPLSLVPGQRVTVTGVKATFANRPVFLVRSVNTGSETFNVRTKSGFLITPRMKEHIAKASSKLGGAQ